MDINKYPDHFNVMMNFEKYLNKMLKEDNAEIQKFEEFYQFTVDELLEYTDTILFNHINK